MSFVDINIDGILVKMSFGVFIPTDNTKTSISKGSVKSVSLSKEDIVIVTLEDGRTWELSSLVGFTSDYPSSVFPVDEWNGVQLISNEELFNNIEYIIL